MFGERADLIEIRKEAGGPEGPRLHRGARRPGADARRPERLRQPPHRQGPHDRARDHRGLQRRDDQGAQPGGASVHRHRARPRGRQRAPDEGGGAVPRAVARARSAAPRPGGRAGTGQGAGAAVHAVRAAPGRAARDDDSRRHVGRDRRQPLDAGDQRGLARLRQLGPRPTVEPGRTSSRRASVPPARPALVARARHSTDDPARPVPRHVHHRDRRRGDRDHRSARGARARAVRAGDGEADRPAGSRASGC